MDARHRHRELVGVRREADGPRARRRELAVVAEGYVVDEAERERLARRRVVAGGVGREGVGGATVRARAADGAALVEERRLVSSRRVDGSEPLREDERGREDVERRPFRLLRLRGARGRAPHVDGGRGGGDGDGDGGGGVGGGGSSGDGAQFSGLQAQLLRYASAGQPLHQAPPHLAVLPLKPLLQNAFGRFSFSQNQTLFPPLLTCPRAHMPNDLSSPPEAGSTAPTSWFFVDMPVQPIRLQAAVASAFLQKGNLPFSPGRSLASHAWFGRYSKSIPAL